ncbi:MAG TPA: Rieske (2Fe-2S) protein [Gemmatimonadaceae bacterium]|nr:Rieske (2Fe-2S) protein [Gemmatimonadaceae bacterium]
MNRREFVESLSIGGAALALTGCASLVTHSVTPVDGVVRLSMGSIPELGRPGGAARIQPAGSPTPIYVLRDDDADGRPVFTSLSPVCTHRGCTVETQANVLICPCHGSTFARSGTVLRGPADRPLPSYRTSVTADGMIEIRMEDPR